MSTYDAPNEFFVLYYQDGLFVKNVTVVANTTIQSNLFKQYNLWDYSMNIPMIPLNTDGIDISGRNMHVTNCFIHNYDDSICLKPSHKNGFGCTENALIENSIQYGGAGMSVGSVPPNDDINCVQNSIFRNITFYSPLKAIYIKTNSGNNGYGIINNITYENMYMTNNNDNLFPENAFLWPIYIGPQQQKEPNGGGDGCFIDFVRCPTQWRVNITNISLINVTAVNSVLTNPGIMNCNFTNPCTGFIFNNVKYINITYHNYDDLYYCHNVYGNFTNVSPKPICINHNITNNF